MPDLDNTSKRRSSVQILESYNLAPPEPTLVFGDISQADRQHIAWTYSGILAAGAAAGQPFMKPDPRNPDWSGEPGPTRKVELIMAVTKELKIGQVYSIHHKRKGHFVAQLIGIEHTPEGDEADDIFLKVKYDVRQGTSQANLAISPKDRVRVSGLRPSLIHSMEPTEEQSWLREVKVPEEALPKPDKKLLARLRDLIG